MYHTRSRSTGHRSRSQRDITYQHQKNATDKLSKVKLSENYSRAKRNTQRNVQGHKVKHLNCNNSAVDWIDCSTALKYGTAANVQGQRSRPQRKVMYQQQKMLQYVRQWIGSATSKLAWRRD